MPRDAFVDHCVELLAPLGAVRVRRMFGGHGFYVDEVFCAIVAWERLYLKVNDDTRPRFEAAGCEPFVYDAKNGSVALGYYSAPADAVESPALMLPWARLALQAALAARAAKPLKAPKAPKAPVKRRAAPAATRASAAAKKTPRAR